MLRILHLKSPCLVADNLSDSTSSISNLRYRMWLLLSDGRMLRVRAERGARGALPARNRPSPMARLNHTGVLMTTPKGDSTMSQTENEEYAADESSLFDNDDPFAPKPKPISFDDAE